MDSAIKLYRKTIAMDRATEKTVSHALWSWERFETSLILK